MRRATPAAAVLCILPLGAVAPAQAPEPNDFVAILPDAGDAAALGATLEAYAAFLRQAGAGDFRPQIVSKVAEADAFVARRRASGKGAPWGVVGGLLLARKASSWGVVPIACPSVKSSTTARHVVVAPRSSAATSVASLAGQRISVPRSWLETPDLLGLVLLQGAGKVQAHFSSVTPADDPGASIVQVMRREVDAAMMSRLAYDVAQKRNREVWKELKVVEELPALHLAPVVAPVDAPAELVEKVRTALTGAAASAEGKKLLDAVNIDGFQACGSAELDAVEGALLAKLSAATGAPAASGAPASGAAAAAEAPAAPAVDGEAKDVAVKGIEVERDGDTGDINAVVTFGGKAPQGIKAWVGVDGAPDREMLLECAENVCILTLAAADAQGKAKMMVQLFVERDGKRLSVGARKSYAIGS